MFFSRVQLERGNGKYSGKVKISSTVKHAMSTIILSGSMRSDFKMLVTGDYK